MVSVNRPRIAVLGGAVAGLAATEQLREFAEIDLYERQSYDEKRVNCGEGITEASLVPLAKTPENGFINRVDGFDVEIYGSTDRNPKTAPLTVSRLVSNDGYITDRNVVERRWAERLRDDDAVTIHEEANVTVARYQEFVEEYEYLIDATGQPSLTSKVRGETDAYTGEMVALNADVSGDFADIITHPRVVFENYLGYFWVFPKSETRANVGIGWIDDARPDEYMTAFWAACDRADVPRPQRAETNVYTIPQGPSLAPKHTHPESGVFLVGDAAGIANRYQGEGICQAIRSAYLLGDLLERERGDAYPEQLYTNMKSEYLIAAVIRGVMEESGDTELLAALADAVDGLTVSEITREPDRLLTRLMTRPRLLVRLLRIPGIRARFRDAYHDRWEFGHPDHTERSATLPRISDFTR